LPTGPWVNLTWNYPAFDGGQPITSYIVKYARRGQGLHLGSWTTVSETGTNRRARIDGLEPGVYYVASVTAVNRNGKSLENPTVTFHGATPPGAPTIEEFVICDNEWGCPASGPPWNIWDDPTIPIVPERYTILMSWKYSSNTGGLVHADGHPFLRFHVEFTRDGVNWISAMAPQFREQTDKYGPDGTQRPVYFYCDLCVDRGDEPWDLDDPWDAWTLYGRVGIGSVDTRYFEHGETLTFRVWAINEVGSTSSATKQFTAPLVNADRDGWPLK
jgi:hypothetical protein